MITKLVVRVLVAAGVVAAVVGGLALLLRPTPVVHPTADLDATVLVIPPDVVALEGLGDITVTAPATVDIRTARPTDAYAWAAGIEVEVVRGLETWEEIQVSLAGTISGEVPEFPGDLWRWWRLGFEESTFKASDVEPGLAVVVVSGSEAPLGHLTFEMTRDRGNGWGWPTLATGLGALTAGLVMLVVQLVRARLSGGGSS